MLFTLCEGWIFDHTRWEERNIANVDAGRLLGVEGFEALGSWMGRVNQSAVLLGIVMIVTHFVKNYEIKNKIKIISCFGILTRYPKL